MRDLLLHPRACLVLTFSQERYKKLHIHVLVSIVVDFEIVARRINIHYGSNQWSTRIDEVSLKFLCTRRRMISARDESHFLNTK